MQPRDDQGNPLVERRTQRARSRIGRVPGDIALAKSFYDRPRLGGFVGARLGWEYIPAGRSSPNVIRGPVYSCGKVQVGLQSFYLGVREGSTAFYLAQARRLWRVPGAHLTAPAVAMRRLRREDLGRARAMADAYKRAFCALAQPGVEHELHNEAVTRYQGLVQKLMLERQLRCEAAGAPREAEDFAKGASSTWTARDFTHTLNPSLLHALLVSLVLGLEAKAAASLIQLGSLIEFRVAVITLEAAELIWRQTAQLLGAMCPEWYERSFLTDWKSQGSIERIFQGQWNMLLRTTWGKGGGIGVATAQDMAALNLPPLPAESHLYEEDDAEDANEDVIDQDDE